MWYLSVAGHITTGQDSLNASAREINEDVSVILGYNVEVKDFRYMYSFRKQQKFSEEFIERQFYAFFILRKNDLDIKNIRFQSSEVQDIKFVNINELNVMRENNLMVKRHECYDELQNYLFRI